MRWRLLAFVPPAAFLATVSLMIASSLVAGLESRVRRPAPGAMPVTWIESECRRLERQILAVSKRATGCDADLRCLGSPILCPLSMDETHEREYRALRREHAERCAPDGATARAGQLDPLADPACPAISEAFDASDGASRHTRAIFWF
jgi:hypothetical protein